MVTITQTTMKPNPRPLKLRVPYGASKFIPGVSSTRQIEVRKSFNLAYDTRTGMRTLWGNPAKQVLLNTVDDSARLARAIGRRGDDCAPLALRSHAKPCS
jgi:hypothetical protein